MRVDTRAWDEAADLIAAMAKGRVEPTSERLQAVGETFQALCGLMLRLRAEDPRVKAEAQLTVAATKLHDVPDQHRGAA